MVRFLLVFGLLTGISSWQPFISGFREPYCALLARTVGFVLSLTPLDLDPIVTGSTISVGFGYALRVVPSCDGLVLLFLFIAGVAAARVQPSLRPYLIAGAFLTLLVVINWFRLAILALTSFYQPGVFEVVHIYVIQGVLIFAVGLLFMLWLSRVDVQAAPLEAARADAQSS